LNQKNGFANTQRGEMIATSVGASATGRGGNFLLADDLIHPQQANSDLEREHAIRWLDETYSTRLDDKRTGRMIVIEQRTHLADLTGHLLEQGAGRTFRCRLSLNARPRLSFRVPVRPSSARRTTSYGPRAKATPNWRRLGSGSASSPSNRNTCRRPSAARAI
jgi:hypothetical protein